MRVYRISHQSFMTAPMKIVFTLTIMGLFYSVLPHGLAYMCMTIAALILVTVLIAEKAERKNFSIHKADRSRIIHRDAQHSSRGPSSRVLKKRPAGFRSGKDVASGGDGVHYDLNRVHSHQFTKEDLDTARPAIASKARHDLEKLESAPPHRLALEDEVNDDIPLHLSLEERLKILEHRKKSEVFRPGKHHPIDRLKD